jgi:N-acetylneuraminate synthase
MKIAHRDIGPEHLPLVVPEIGINHGGNLLLAKQMAYAAREAGAEIIKHQTHFVDDEYTDEARTVIPPNATKSIWEIMEECSLAPEEEVELKVYAESLGLIYISTPFSRKAADFLNDIGVAAFKIGSGECDHLPLIRHIGRFGKPVIMSTGMQTVDSVRGSVTVLDQAGVNYALLECTNLYPSPPANVSLHGVVELKKAYPNAIVGFSDHSIGPCMALAAVALGACIVERHFTDSRYRKGPDIPCSMDPAELKYLIERSREIHVASRNLKQRTEEEEDTYLFARSSVVADCDLPTGTVITGRDIWARRPGTGEIPGSDFDKVVGCTLRRSVKRNQQLRWEDFEA